MDESGSPQGSKRTALQTLGLLLALVGALMVTVGVIDFISSQAYGDGNGVGWVALIGVPLAAAGGLMVKANLKL